MIKGLKIPNQISPPANYNAFLRYYRISGLSNNVYEAYRNLYLSFEEMLSLINKKNNVGERKWLSNTLSIINNHILLLSFCPSGTTDPIKYFIEEQYTKIRLKLFHSKDNIIIPESLPKDDVENAYKQLLKIWRGIAASVF